jgi:hypothetical protein
MDMMKKLFLLIIAALLITAQRAWADYVTDIVVIGHDSERQVGYLYDNYKGAGWIGIDRDLNDGAGGHYIHLVYKTNKSPQNSGTPITNVFLRLSDGPGPASLVHEGRTYYRVGADGDSRFISSGGDLNCNAGGRWVQLYYTKDDNHLVHLTSITINGEKSGAVGRNGSDEPCDLNTSAGGDDIYMHITRGLASNHADVYNSRQLLDVASFNNVNIRMMADINVSRTVTFGSGVNTLDLNGHTLNRGLKEPAASGTVVTVPGLGHLTIQDSSADHSGVITGGASSDNGGAIYNEGTLTITGGTITGNTCNGRGGGIWTERDGFFGSHGTLNIQGNVVITGNTASGYPDDVYLNDGQVINVTGPLAKGASIGVSTNSPDVSTITSGYATHNGGTDPNTFFHSNSDFKLSANGSGEVTQSGPTGNWIDYRAAEFSHVVGSIYYIESEEELALLSYRVNKGHSFYRETIVLNRDLNLSAHEWTPIGKDSFFQGDFDGNGHTISGMYINANYNYVGLFANVDGLLYATIQNLSIKKAYVKGNYYVGGLAGKIYATTSLKNIYCEARVSGYQDVGGIVGSSLRSITSADGIPKTINCLFKGGKVSGNKNVGAIVGFVEHSHEYIHTYYAHGGSAVGNPDDVRAYPVYLDHSEGVSVRFDTSASGVVFNDTAYYPAGTAKFTVASDPNYSITSVKVNGTEVGTTAGTYQFNINSSQNEGYVITATTQTSADLVGSGTASDPYLVTSTDDWNLIANKLRSGGAQNSKHYKLTADITVSDRLGTPDYPFRGTFDGDGHTLTAVFGSPDEYLDMICSPFYSIQDATIRNLIVDGNIYTSGQYTGGLVGKAFGLENLIQNCVSRVSINSNRDGDCSNGGFVGLMNTNSTHVDFKGCAFTGELVGTNATNWGGFVGWRNYVSQNRNTANFTDCLFAPTKVDIAMPDGSNSCTFSRSNEIGLNISYKNCYYQTSLQINDGGKQIHSISAGEHVTMEAVAMPTEYTVSGITSYGVGVKMNNVLYAGKGDKVSLNLSGSATNRYRDDGYHSLAGTENPYTLTMPNQDATIVAWKNLRPTELASEEDWNTFRMLVHEDEDYARDTVTMTADITTSFIPDYHDATTFRGTFDGGGHTLTLAYGSLKNFLNHVLAPFRHIDGATIQNLVVAGSNYSAIQYNSSVVGTVTGTGNLIKNCISRASINCNWSGDCGNGGFIGNMSGDGCHVDFEGCVFAGEFVAYQSEASMWTVEPSGFGGFVGFRTYDDKNRNTVNFTNCLFDPTRLNVRDAMNYTFCRTRTKTTEGTTFANCFYLKPLGTIDGGKQVYSITGDEEVAVEGVDAGAEYDVSNITIYGTGIKYNDVLYGASGEQVSLTLKYLGTAIPADKVGYYASGGTLTGTSNPYTLAMTGSNTVIHAWKWAHPIEIASAEDWNDFGNAIRVGSDYAGETVTMTADVAASTMAGGDGHPFRGTFDGGGHTLALAFGSPDQYSNQSYAPFYCIENATIRNLVIDGSIYSSEQFNASLAYKATGSGNLIQNIISCVSINSNRDGDCTNAGFIARLIDNNSKVSFEGCAFTGELLGDKATNWGGFVGWREYQYNNYNTVNFTDCLFAPASIDIATPGGSNSHTFCRSRDNNNGATYVNSYYDTVLQTAGGCKQSYSFFALPANVGTAGTSYDVSGIEAYTRGLKYDGLYYVDHVGLIDNAANTEIIGEMASRYSGQPINITLQDRTLYLDGNWNTLCLPFDVTLHGSTLVGAEARTLIGSIFDHSTGTLTLNFSDPVETLTAGTPYIIKWMGEYADLVISSTAEWDTFAKAVNNGTDYSGKVVTLANDIEVSTTAGSTDHPFRGTFNGRGHTLNLNLTGGQGCAPFISVDNGTIVNLRTAGTITASMAAGFVYSVKGTVNISNCRSSVEIDNTTNGMIYGGFVASGDVNYTDCLFDGTFKSDRVSVRSGFVAVGKGTFKNCVSMNDANTRPFSYSSNDITVTNCYYVNNVGNSQGNVIGSMTNEQLAAALGDGWQVKDGVITPVVTSIGSANTIVNSAFADVIVTAAEPVGITPGLAPGTEGDASVTFCGTYDPVEIGKEGDNTKLYFSTGNTLYWPNGAMTINPFRAYFQLNTTAATRGVVVNFGDGNTTGISDAMRLNDKEQMINDNWYTLDGRKIANGQKPTAKGLYIKNGKKYIIK